MAVTPQPWDSRPVSICFPTLRSAQAAQWWPVDGATCSVKFPVGCLATVSLPGDRPGYGLASTLER